MIHPIIILWNFAPTFEYALNVRRLYPNEIILTHVLGPDSPFKNEKEATTSLQTIAKNYLKNIISHFLPAFQKVRLSDFAFQRNASLVIMGTQGIQNLTGISSWRIIAGSRSPFLAVHGRPP
jgi:hypothetical protein